MKIAELLEATHRVPAGTFDKKGPTPAVDNSIKKIPAGPKLDMKQEFPIIDSEFGRRLYDKDIVDAVKDESNYTDAEWNAVAVIDQIKHQLDIVSPPPRKGESWATAEMLLDAKAKAIMAKLKFIEKE